MQNKGTLSFFMQYSIRDLNRFNQLKNKIIVGTKASQIMEIQEKSSNVQSVIVGHAEGELWGLAVHPTKEIYCTSSYDGFLRVWDLRTKVGHLIKSFLFCLMNQLLILFEENYWILQIGQ